MAYSLWMKASIFKLQECYSKPKGLSISRHWTFSQETTVEILLSWVLWCIICCSFKQFYWSFLLDFVFWKKSLFLFVVVRGDAKDTEQYFIALNGSPHFPSSSFLGSQNLHFSHSSSFQSADRAQGLPQISMLSNQNIFLRFAILWWQLRSSGKPWFSCVDDLKKRGKHLQTEVVKIDTLKH